MTSFTITAHRVDNHISQAGNEYFTLPLGTDMDGNKDALNPMEMLMAALAACMIKGTNRLMPLLPIRIDSMDITFTATRQDSPPKVATIDYQIQVASPDDDDRLALLHENLVKFGTVTNTIAQGTTLRGTLVRKVSP
jgi:uncharacterized OsmC-like protein